MERPLRLPADPERRLLHRLSVSIRIHLPTQVRKLTLRTPTALFVKSCPASNPALPVKTLAPFSISEAAPAHGAVVGLTFTQPQGAQASAPAFVAWLSGLGVVFSDVTADGKTTVPPGLEGTVFAALTSSNQGPLTDDTLLSGFTFVEFSTLR